MEPGDHLFRHEAGRMVATLARIFGVRNLAPAEDVVQDAFCRNSSRCDSVSLWWVFGFSCSLTAMKNFRYGVPWDLWPATCRRSRRAVDRLWFAAFC